MKLEFIQNFLNSLTELLVPHEIVALLEKPWLLAMLLALGAVLGMLGERLNESLRKAERKARWKNRTKFWRNRKATTRTSKRTLAADQLHHVMNAKFTRRPLLNKSEQRVLAVLDSALESEAPGWRAMGQVNLGEFLASNDDEAFSAINSKRVDFLIIDVDCRPIHAIEFQGTGHHMGKNTAARDAVKKEALRRAGVGYLEVTSGDTPGELRAKIRKLYASANS